MKKFMSILSLVLVLGIAGLVSADQWQCEKETIKEGDSLIKVMKLCGNPDSYDVIWSIETTGIGIGIGGWTQTKSKVHRVKTMILMYREPTKVVFIFIKDHKVDEVKIIHIEK